MMKSVILTDIAKTEQAALVFNVLHEHIAQLTSRTLQIAKLKIERRTAFLFSEVSSKLQYPSIMPRQGSGHISHNAEETGHDVIHGTGQDKSDHVDRADKTAPMPEHEKGSAIEGMNASGGGSSGISQGLEAGQGGRGMK
ncbi:uncharacterized protein PV09_00988 [Verruconis gallopava]|uniref:Uncharacterized protein n=1 Tax=Verruconis gallopava TaxID=253628 RepID=A0A0D2B9Y4_9PEZI|nr:uncharacterized protein PV09_00988 [Verruconis gallopava]KIW08044.1 hypothetical protein PV09_00988 [Verruconis gallopava]